MTKKKIIGICRVCGEERQLTEEHYIPRAAGGGVRAVLYTGDELMKALHADEECNAHKPRGKSNRVVYPNTHYANNAMNSRELITTRSLGDFTKEFITCLYHSSISRMTQRQKIF